MKFRAKLVRCVDGDTVDFDVDLGFHVTVRERFRLLEVDTPERGKPGFSECTDFLKGLLEEIQDVDDYISIETTKTGKYGRWLVTIWIQSSLAKDPHHSTDELCTVNRKVREFSLQYQLD
ncbi:MAG: thermonuclease family protein [Candidatus Thorarchaeota archaeon]